MPMQFNITNHLFAVGHIEVLGVSSASMLQVGDSDAVALYSMFDTPPESLIVGPLAPLPLPEDSSEAIGESTVDDG